MKRCTAVTELRPILKRWAALPALPDQSGEDQLAYAEDVSSLFLWLHSLDLVRELASEEPDELDELLFRIGRTMTRLGDPSGAAETFSRAAEGLAAGPLPLRAVRHLNQLGEAYRDIDDPLRAEEAYRRALALVIARAPSSPEIAFLESNLAGALCTLGRNDEAEHYVAESLRLIERAESSAVERIARQLGTRSTRADLLGDRLHTLAEIELAKVREADGAREAARGRRAAAKHLEEALGYYQGTDGRMRSHVLEAELMLAAGRAAEADQKLAALELEALEDRRLHRHLPAIYRRRAQASRSFDALGDALKHCRRALTTSLKHANRQEERLIIDTFLEILGEAHVRDASLDADSRQGMLIAARQFRRRYGDVVDDLVEFLERKDWYTGRAHSKSVANVSQRIGKAMLEEDPGADVELEVLELAAVLHDIGKLRVPWALLNKIVPVRKDEMAALKRHGIEGFNILSSLGLGRLAEISAEHHERIDGRGYPFAKTQPSAMGNILAAADAFEAMTTINRRWRPAKKKNIAVRELVSLEGSWFYPSVTSALKRAFR